MSILIAICIITCRRPEGLLKLLKSLDNLYFSTRNSPSIALIIVDNDPQQSAQKIVTEWHHETNFHVAYHQETEPGIPFARNRAIKEALALSADKIAFLDDDEYVDPNWLEAMVDMQNKSNASIIWGPVFPVYEIDTVPLWIINGGFYDRQRYEDGQVLHNAASNNVLIKSHVFDDQSLRFNENMRYTGGSDHLFFKQAACKGHIIVWSARAKVWEDVPASRLTESWLCNRFLRLGNTHTITEIALDPSITKLTLLALQGMIRLIPSAMILPFTPFLPKVRAMKIKRSYYRGLGMLKALVNKPYQEYKPTENLTDNYLGKP
ncbi:mycofactocin system glycosyltransferase [Nitrincola nitratireducens]|uniref:Mycofactocin system glycosyltransferase n=2 Tax=Nitrincola nitratireducens TaxID=1229521 RepID=W9UYP6_9GAMM|nr:mycofactocin system glycosyltransferase [Nitrincola nitratireducens]